MLEALPKDIQDNLFYILGFRESWYRISTLSKRYQKRVKALRFSNESVSTRKYFVYTHPLMQMVSDGLYKGIGKLVTQEPENMRDVCNTIVDFSQDMTLSYHEQAILLPNFRNLQKYTCKTHFEDFGRTHTNFNPMAVGKLITLNRQTLTKISFPLKLFSDGPMTDGESVFFGLTFPNLRQLDLTLYTSDERFCFESDRVSAIHAFLRKLNDIFPVLEELSLSAHRAEFELTNADEVALCNLGNNFFEDLAKVIKSAYPSVRITLPNQKAEGPVYELSASLWFFPSLGE
jgi:hypothetical protein